MKILYENTHIEYLQGFIAEFTFLKYNGRESVGYVGPSRRINRAFCL